ncbi:MAG: FHA domain-containing protein, partial [Ruminococcus sp.]|nr:FHA domain-containing protein [Ruminococcus sp.]
MFDISVIYDAGVVGLRMIMPLLAIVIVYQCYAAMRRRRRPEKPLVSLYNPKSGGMIPVVFWENSIGRSKSSDIVINDLSVSRNHCVLLRRKAGWFVSDVGSLSGTFVNGVRIHGRAQVLVDDIIAIGNTEYQLRRGDDFNSPLRASRFFSKVSDKPAIQAWKLMFMITMFHLFMAVEAMFWNDGTNVYAPMFLFAALAAVEWGFFSVSYFALRRVNFELEALGLFLTGIGVMMLVRQVERSAYVQLIAAAIGIVLYCVIIKFIEDPDRSDKIRFPVMIFAVLLLASSIVLGRVTNGAANWVYIGSISFQPSEFVKTIFIFIGASALDKLQTKRNLIEFIIFSVVCVGLLALM